MTGWRTDLSHLDRSLCWLPFSLTSPFKISLKTMFSTLLTPSSLLFHEQNTSFEILSVLTLLHCSFLMVFIQSLLLYPHPMNEKYLITIIHKIYQNPLCRTISPLHPLFMLLIEFSLSGHSACSQYNECQLFQPASSVCQSKPILPSFPV